METNHLDLEHKLFFVMKLLRQKRMFHESKMKSKFQIKNYKRQLYQKFIEQCKNESTNN